MLDLNMKDAMSNDSIFQRQGAVKRRRMHNVDDTDEKMGGCHQRLNSGRNIWHTTSILGTREVSLCNNRCDGDENGRITRQGAIIACLFDDHAEDREETNEDSGNGNYIKKGGLTLILTDGMSTFSHR